MSAPFIFSKTLDPLFAILVGATAAGVRINREEKEKGRSTQESLESLKARFGLVLGGGEDDRQEQGKVGAGAGKGV
ncbi:hypothetical protein K431DRAFT_305981 [Polychaeton citri CBS 116435]|uniref:Uncharacterized protein n=1 Tax=Polychaeton citri CBS 116435 TaxID=1314669 RepID=A0A9P4Q0X9_9PEZI|nr:hypothetical protein K431DRAFT_305981 [Polychaeton citri CBS 116435]